MVPFSVYANVVMMRLHAPHSWTISVHMLCYTHFKPSIYVYEIHVIMYLLISIYSSVIWFNLPVIIFLTLLINIQFHLAHLQVHLSHINTWPDKHARWTMPQTWQWCIAGRWWMKYLKPVLLYHWGVTDHCELWDWLPAESKTNNISHS